MRGICLLDEDKGTYRSLFTLKLICKRLDKQQVLPYQTELGDAILRDANEEPYGFVSEYSYSFYPDMRSKRAKEIGYFRFDFHPDLMGDGDTGGHPYFHCHTKATGEELEEVEFEDSSKELKVAQSLRLPTGLILPDVIIRSLECN